MNYGQRIVFDKNTGKVISVLGEISGSIQEGLSPSEIDYLDLPFGDITLKTADTFHIDIATKKIIIDTTKTVEPTYEELKQQLLSLQGVV